MVLLPSYYRRAASQVRAAAAANTGQHPQRLTRQCCPRRYPKAAFGHRQAAATEDGLQGGIADALARVGVLMDELAGAQQAGRARLVQQEAERGFKLARRVAGRSLTREVKIKRRVLLTDGHSQLARSALSYPPHCSCCRVRAIADHGPDATAAYRRGCCASTGRRGGW